MAGVRPHEGSARDVLRIAPAVAAALAERAPVVALETTLVTHGFAPPDGLDVAQAMEQAVRDAGAIPASIGVLDGHLVVGITAEQLERLATHAPALKLGLANLAAGIAKAAPGSTTVAATLLAAARAGITVFATGGIGGVHRDAPHTGDVSGDLAALARFPVAVVCSGAKAVLDVPRTREALETLGVPVLGYRTDRFPGFYRRDSGLPADARLDDIDSLARAVATHLALGTGGVLVGNPIPERDELSAEVHDRVLDEALGEATRAGVRGRDVTPWLLARLARTSDGATVRANRALLVSNARVSAQLAVAVAAR